MKVICLIFVLFQTISYLQAATRNAIVFHGNVPSNLYINAARGKTDITHRGPRDGDSNIVRLLLYPADKRSRAPKMATAVIRGGYVQGELVLHQVNPPVSPTIIDGTITGLIPGIYAINIHSLGDMIDGCASIGKIYNPYTLSREWQPFQRYMGDLGTIEADETGTADVFINDPFVSLVGPRAIVGRAISLTALPKGDELQNIETNPKIACGVIGYAS